jgi:two-component system, NtrC family, sensor histidine kinase HydH
MNDWSKTLLIAVSIVLVTVLHFLTPTDQIVLHEIYQRFYYLPIIAAALLYGFRGGLFAAIFTTIVYVPHILIHWSHSHTYTINQFAETVIFIAVGAIMGILGDQLKVARQRAERLADERQNAFDELQNTFTQLLQAEKLSSLGELSAGIVHEIRNPLASIKGAVEILEDGIPKESPRREFAALAKKEVDRIDKLVGEFLRFAKPARLSMQPTDLNEIIESVALLIEQQAANDQVSIVKNLQNNLSPVSVDAEQIRQVLLNLALNSLQAMKNGGKLTFRTVQKDKLCQIEVEDEGGGIDAEIMPKIFNPFFTTKEKGVGLGLSVAHQIIEQHGGKMSVRNEKKGACFTLEIKIPMPEKQPQS